LNFLENDLQIKPKVGTVAFGVAASQGALLLAGGEKGMRYAMPNTRVMIHQPQTGCGVWLLNSPCQYQYTILVGNLICI